MIGYVTLGTNDLKRGAAFYDALLGEIGARRSMEFEGFIVWANSKTGPSLALASPYDKKKATVGNGVMVALEAQDEAQVQRLYDIALANGGSDEGAPGDRGGGFYAGYFRDPDGNKLNAFVMKG